MPTRQPPQARFVAIVWGARAHPSRSGKLALHYGTASRFAVLLPQGLIIAPRRRYA